MDFRMVFVAVVAIYIVQDAKTDAKKAPAIVHLEPDEIYGFRANISSCHVCHPEMDMCGKRIDCCVTANDEHIQACPKSPHNVCYKTEVYDGTFFNVTRGCGKKHAGHASGQSDKECIKFGANEANTVCNCVGLNCNSGSRTAFSLALLLVPVAYILKTLL